MTVATLLACVCDPDKRRYCPEGQRVVDELRASYERMTRNAATTRQRSPRLVDEHRKATDAYRAHMGIVL